MSLRARLIALLLVLAGIGMLVLAGVTYGTQRAFLLERVDDQTLAAGAVLGPGRDFDGPDRGPRGRRGGPPPAADLPPGTYAERRDASGAVLDSRVVSVGGEALSPPEIPARLPPGTPRSVPAEDGSGLEYRVRATPLPFGQGFAVVAVPLDGVDATLERLLLVEALVIAGVLALLALASAALVRAGLRPLERIGATAGAIAAGDLSRRVDVASERTEVGRLGLALNAMLGRLERAFAERAASEERLRRFLSDASHELRTPLASIRGYAELFRIGATRGPQDTEKAMRRIEEEAARMGVLVEDLLTLARLDEVRDVAAEPVDLALLAEDAVGDARATDPERPIALEAGQADLTVDGEPDRLRQVLANLLRNALVHTPPGTPVRVTVRGDDGHAELTVRDSGPGLPPGADGDALFERFWRSGGEGRERGRAGAGLGLAIVAGIVTAHHGTVRAGNAAGGGAEFVVRLPLSG